MPEGGRGSCSLKPQVSHDPGFIHGNAEGDPGELLPCQFSGIQREVKLEGPQSPGQGSEAAPAVLWWHLRGQGGTELVPNPLSLSLPAEQPPAVLTPKGCPGIIPECRKQEWGNCPSLLPQVRPQLCIPTPGGAGAAGTIPEETPELRQGW